jgi:hypothetical protein
MSNIIQDLPKKELVNFVENLPEFSTGDTSLVPAFTPVQEIAPIEINLTHGTDEEELEADFQEIRKNLNEVAAKSSIVIDDLLGLSRSLESPRSYEVLINAINSLAGANKDILEAHAKRADIKKKIGVQSVPDNQTNVQNNNVFVGSTSELLEMLGRK